MAIGEETLIDAPVTPAPVFAYRALKAVFWGEEQTPDQRARRIDNDVSELLETVKQPAEVGKGPTIVLTPTQKRKYSALAQPSPTKSILRAPGAHTPRRALLKDLNVTFKDLRKSISPEMQAKGRVVMKDDKENRPMISTLTTATSKLGSTSERASKPHLMTTKSNHNNISPSKAAKQDGVAANNTHASDSVTALAPTATNTIAFDVESYRRSTEKDMKKLIKYGQKMREYARRHESDNIKLRLMLDEVQAENDRLRKQIEIMRGTSESMSDKAAENDRVTSAKSSRSQRVGKAHGMSEEKATKTRLNKTENSDLLDLDNLLASAASRQSNAAQPKPPHEDHHPILDPDYNRNTNQAPGSKRTSSVAKRSKESRLPVFSDDEPELKTTPEPQVQQLTLRQQPDITITSRLAPDRLAAARARVRKKAELRKVSAEIETEAGAEAEPGMEMDSGVRVGVEKAAKDRHVDEIRKMDGYRKMNANDIDKVETSLVDWTGL